MGYESNEDIDNGFRPEGLIRLSTTTGPTPQYLTDYGNVVVEWGEIPTDEQTEALEDCVS